MKTQTDWESNICFQTGLHTFSDSVSELLLLFYSVLSKRAMKHLNPPLRVFINILFAVYICSVYFGCAQSGCQGYFLSSSWQSSGGLVEGDTHHFLAKDLTFWNQDCWERKYAWSRMLFGGEKGKQTKRWIPHLKDLATFVIKIPSALSAAVDTLSVSSSFYQRRSLHMSRINIWRDLLHFPVLISECVFIISTLAWQILPGYLCLSVIISLLATRSQTACQIEADYPSESTLTASACGRLSALQLYCSETLRELGKRLPTAAGRRIL